MPKRFRITQSDNTVFTCSMTCATCSQQTRNGQACRKRACHGMPVCWMHARTIYNISAKQSTIPNAGKGLFAHKPSVGTAAGTPVFNAGDWICPYGGEAKTAAQLDDRYGVDGEAPYALCNGPVCTDAACVRGWGSFANHARRPTVRRPNAEFVLRDHNFWLRALRPIRHDSEIFTDYGQVYGFDAIHATR